MEITKSKRVNYTEKKLQEMTVGQSRLVENISCHLTRDFLKPEEARKRNFSPCEPGFTWKRDREKVDRSTLSEKVDINNAENIPPELSLGNNAWFRLSFKLPEGFSLGTSSLRFRAQATSSSEMSPIADRPAVEAQCYAKRNPIQSFDHGHEFLKLENVPQQNGRFDLMVEVGTTLLWGGLDVDEFILEKAELVETRKEVRKLYFDFKSFNDLRKQLPEDSPLRKKILNKLTEASHSFPFGEDSENRITEGSKDAMRIIEDLKDLESEFSDLKLITTGHAHIDAAWLWPWSETVRKSGRTFSNALKLMEEYPDFRFLQSQPHIYEFVKNRFPKLFDRIKKKVDSRDWEPVGGTWIESDVNISGGEALARQYLYGKRYFRKEFGIDPKITFIPDVFGYSASLPGIARSANCPYFFTQKMSWSEVNDFPHHTFVWEGIDGSQLIAHFPPADTYNGMTFQEPVDEVVKSAKNFREKGELNRAAYLIGWGDGGGGPNRDMVEQVEAINDIEALPDLEFGQLKNFFKGLEKNSEKLEKWIGELYLERHRGTFTTHGDKKRNNRKLEFALREAEILSSTALLGGNSFQYPKDALDGAWKTLLFNQFHDILPGSSIREVYEDADRDYGKALDSTRKIISEASKDIVEHSDSKEKLFVFNSLSWVTDRLVEAEAPNIESDEISAVDPDGNRLPIQRSGRDEEKIVFNATKLPSLGGKTFKIEPECSNYRNDITVTERDMENSKIKIVLSKDGSISTLEDKKEEREVFDGPGNELIAYRDLPTEFDAWELEGDIYDVSNRLPAPQKTYVIESGPLRGILRQEREFGNSKLVQDIVIYSDSKRIDLETRVDWHEKDTLLKTHFPIAVSSREATFEIQYGHYNRPTHSNTSWDRARFEVPHQKWVDVSEYGFGAALLNDSKYGVNVDETNIGLSLLRGPSSPDPEADMGSHDFIYSLLPHEGDFRDAGVIKQAYELNTEAVTTYGEPVTGFDSLVTIEEDGVIVEAVKKSEENGEKALIIRIYEAWGRTVSTGVTFGFGVDKILETNLVEDEKSKLELQNDTLQLELTPFEITTLKVFYE
ncbi:alpha-mannosidase [Candidatus Bipolaricaulota bacterium]|nr:alpha-mannosidase [Candidatus Bipolaricaulota bacterium]